MTIAVPGTPFRFEHADRPPLSELDIVRTAKAALLDDVGVEEYSNIKAQLPTGTDVWLFTWPDNTWAWCMRQPETGEPTPAELIEQYRESWVIDRLDQALVPYECGRAGAPMIFQPKRSKQ